MSQNRRQDFARPPGPRPEHKRDLDDDRAYDREPARLSQLRNRFAATFGKEQAILT